MFLTVSDCILTYYARIVKRFRSKYFKNYQFLFISVIIGHFFDSMKYILNFFRALREK